MDKNGYDLHIKSQKCIIQSPKSNIVAQIPLIRGLYRVTSPLTAIPSTLANAAVKAMSISELHCKMGHINCEDLQRNGQR